MMVRFQRCYLNLFNKICTIHQTCLSRVEILTVHMQIVLADLDPKCDSLFKQILLVSNSLDQDQAQGFCKGYHQLTEFITSGKRVGMHVDKKQDKKNKADNN